MEGLLAGLLIAQGFDPSLMGEDVPAMIQYGKVMGTFICTGVVVTDNRRDAIDYGVRQYIAKGDLQFPGLMQYVNTRPDNHLPKQAYMTSLDNTLMERCPKFFSLPKQ